MMEVFKVNGVFITLRYDHFAERRPVPHEGYHDTAEAALIDLAKRVDELRALTGSDGGGRRGADQRACFGRSDSQVRTYGVRRLSWTARGYRRTGQGVARLGMAG